MFSLIWNALKIVWNIVIIGIPVVFGAVAGWETQGLIGSILLGFGGLLIGTFFAISPSSLLKIILVAA